MQVPIFKIIVGWRPKKVPKVPVFFGLEGTLVGWYIGNITISECSEPQVATPSLIDNLKFYVLFLVARRPLRPHQAVHNIQTAAQSSQSTAIWHNIRSQGFFAVSRADDSLRTIRLHLWWLTVLVTQVCTEFHVVRSEVMSSNDGLSNAKLSTVKMQNIGIGPKKPYRSSSNI